MGDNRNVRRSPQLAALVASFLRSRTTGSWCANKALSRLRNLARLRLWEGYLFGGVPRGFWINGLGSPIRDFDIVFSDGAFSELEVELNDLIVSRNRFGGLKIVMENIAFDIWPLSKTWAFREQIVSPAEFRTLPMTTFLNVDSLVVELAPRPGKRRNVYEHCFFKAWRSRSLDICVEQNPFPALCVIRALRMAQSFQMKLSWRLCEYIVAYYEQGDLAAFEVAQQKHYGRLIYTMEDLSSAVDAIYGAPVAHREEGVMLFEKPVRQMELELWDEWLAT